MPEEELEKEMIERMKPHLQRAEQRLKILEKELTRAARARVPVEPIRVKYRDLSAKIAAIKAEYKI